MCELWPRHGHGRSLRDNHFGRRILCKHTWYFMIPKRYCCDTCKQTRAEKIREAEAVLQTAAQSTGVYAAQGNGRSSLPPSLPPRTNFSTFAVIFFPPLHPINTGSGGGGTGTGSGGGTTQATPPPHATSHPAFSVVGQWAPLPAMQSAAAAHAAPYVVAGMHVNSLPPAQGQGADKRRKSGRIVVATKRSEDLGGAWIVHAHRGAR
jgi:hypothetical protein